MLCAVSSGGRLRDGNDQIQIRHDNGELPAAAVGAVGAFPGAHPHLEAIAHKVVCGNGVVDGFGSRFILQGGCHGHIVLVQDPLPVDHTAVQVQLHQPQVVLGGGLHPMAPHIVFRRHFVGEGHPGINTDLVKEAGLQVIVNRGAGNPLDDVRQQGGACAVIEESRAGLVDLGLEEKSPAPTVPREPAWR